MSTTFRAAVVRTPSGPDSIEIIDVPVVEPGPGQVRVEIVAATVNPVDLGVAAGFFHERGLVHQPDHTGLGWDFAGIVAAAGPDVDLPLGTRVAGLIDGFDRDFGTYAEQLVVAASDTAVVPDGLELATAATVPLNGLAAALMVDLLGEGEGRSLLVTGAAGAVGGYVLALAQDHGWRVTGLARVEDEEFVRGLGADFTAHAAPGWDAVADGAVLKEEGLALVRDGGTFIGMQPGAASAEERGVTIREVVTRPDGARLAQLLDATAAAACRRGCTPSCRSTRWPRFTAGGQGRRARAVRPSALRSPCGRPRAVHRRVADVTPDLCRATRPAALDGRTLEPKRRCARAPLDELSPDARAPIGSGRDGSMSAVQWLACRALAVALLTAALLAAPVAAQTNDDTGDGTGTGTSDGTAAGLVIDERVTGAPTDGATRAAPPTGEVLQSPTLTLEPVSGPPGSPVTVDGEGFGACYGVYDDVGPGVATIAWGGESVTTVEVHDGTVSAVVPVPELAEPGSTSVTATCGADGAIAASADFVVTATDEPTDPSEAGAGQPSDPAAQDPAPIPGDEPAADPTPDAGGPEAQAADAGTPMVDGEDVASTTENGKMVGPLAAVALVVTAVAALCSLAVRARLRPAWARAHVAAVAGAVTRNALAITQPSPPAPPARAVRIEPRAGIVTHVLEEVDR